MQRAEQNARLKFEQEMKAAEERRQKEEEDRKRAEEAARIRLEAAIKAEAEAKAAAEKRAAEEAERLKQIQEDAKLKAEAEALAKVEKEKAEAKAKAEAEEQAKKDAEALKVRIQEETKAKLAEEAAAAAAAGKEKPPIRFKDAVGRKFSFPFHLCATWQGMEELIKQAFLQVDVLGPHVQEGHYDLIGPNGEIILPTVWDKVVQPDWSITMTMWPVEKQPPLRQGPPMGGRHHPGIPPPPGARFPPGMQRTSRPPGDIPPPPNWHGQRPMPHGVDVVNAAPKRGKSSKQRAPSGFATFFAGKPAKKKSSKSK
jgi:chemotaxis protein histidine kinase CheA